MQFAAMLSARSPLFLDQAAARVRSSLSSDPNGKVLSRNYGLTAMRSEIPERFHRWCRDFQWALRFTRDPASPVIACDQSVGMEGPIEDMSLAYHDPRTLLFFPISWDMCLVGSPARFDAECAEFVEGDLVRLRDLLAKQARTFVVSPVRLQRLTKA